MTIQTLFVDISLQHYHATSIGYIPIQRNGVCEWGCIKFQEFSRVFMMYCKLPVSMDLRGSDFFSFTLPLPQEKAPVFQVSFRNVRLL